MSDKLFAGLEEVYLSIFRKGKAHIKVANIDVLQLPEDQRQWVEDYKRGIYIATGAFAAAFVLPSIGIFIGLGAGWYGVHTANKAFDKIAASIDPALVTAAPAVPSAAIADGAQPASASPKKSVGKGPWVVYAILADGGEHTFPERFENEEAAGKHLHKIQKKSGSTYTHIAVKYAPED